MVGIILGVFGGIACFLFLYMAVKTFSKKGFCAKAVIFLLLQFLIPFICLILCALLCPGDLLYAAIALSAVIILSAFIYFLYISIKKDKKNG